MLSTTYTFLVFFEFFFVWDLKFLLNNFSLAFLMKIQNYECSYFWSHYRTDIPVMCPPLQLD